MSRDRVVQKATIGDVRAQLARAFPSARFFVSRERFSFGACSWAFRIRWAEGPTFEEVRAVADELQTTGISIHCKREPAE